MSLKDVEKIADAMGGKITEVGGPLPDGSGFAVVSSPLPKDHWIYKTGCCAHEKTNHRHGYAECLIDGCECQRCYTVPPMPFHMIADDRIEIMLRDRDDRVLYRYSLTRDQLDNVIKDIVKYAVRSATMNGQDMDFDPDAMLQNAATGATGYNTPDGMSEDAWANPREPYQIKP